MNSNYVNKFLRSSSNLQRETQDEPIKLNSETGSVKGKIMNTNTKGNSSNNFFPMNENLINLNIQTMNTNSQKIQIPNKLVANNGGIQNPSNEENLKINNVEVNYKASAYTNPALSLRSNSTKAISIKTVFSTINNTNNINSFEKKNTFVNTNYPNTKSLNSNSTQFEYNALSNTINSHSSFNNYCKSNSSFISGDQNGLSASVDFAKGKYDLNSIDTYPKNNPNLSQSSKIYNKNDFEYILNPQSQNSSLIYDHNNVNNNMNYTNKNCLNTINYNPKRISIDTYSNSNEHSHKLSSKTVNGGSKSDINGKNFTNYIDQNGKKCISTNNTSFYSNNTINNNLQEKEDMSFYINLEDLMVLEEKLYQILDNFRASKPSARNCFEWWSFYTYCLIGGKFEFYFKEENHKKVVRESSALELICIIISFEASCDNKVLNTTINILKNLLYLVHQNFLIICDYLVSKINSDSFSNIWVNKIQNLILSKLNKRLKKGEHVILLKQNNENILASLKNIFRIYTPNMNKQIQVDFSMIIYYVKNLAKVTTKTLNEHFRNKILSLNNKNGIKILENLIVEEGDSLPSIPVPYLAKKITNNRIFTLVLDLDETLIHFKINPGSNKGILRLRPGLQEFLSTLSKIYELVVFTASTQEYADPILDSIEKDEQYFDYRLYRQHAIIIENDFVKDLSKLGRDLSKTLIVDNIPQNFKLQKDNGIFIKTFYGEDGDDNALFDLIEILIKITENYDSGTDLRQKIKKFKNEIFRKVTTNVDRSSNFQSNLKN